MSSSFIVGLGSHHGDDQAGWLVMDRLQQRNFPPQQMTRLRHPIDLLDVIDTEMSLVICDACCGSGNPGRIHQGIWSAENSPDQILGPRRDESGLSLIPQFHSGSHTLPLIEVLMLGRQLGCGPSFAKIWTIEGGMWAPGTSPSTAIQAAAAVVAEAIWEQTFHA
jgi:Ni,Fe-hydrogenase maturation factor